MDKSKIKILVVTAIICVLITLLAFFLSTIIKEDKTKEENPTYEINKTFSRVNNYSEFFSIASSISETLNLTEQYYALEMYVNDDVKLKYYFVKGHVAEVEMDDETAKLKSANYLVIVDCDTNKYETVTLNNNIVDLKSYANSYNVVYKKVVSDKVLKDSTKNISVILNFYVEYFKTMLFHNPQTAYKMLDSKTKAKYPSYFEFQNQLADIYNNVSSYVYGYSEEEYDNYKEYTINDKNFNKIIITEYNIMDFKIGF